MGHQTKMIEDVLTRLRAEYLEMPGLRLKAGQVQRLCGIDQTMCQLVLDSLLESKRFVSQAGRSLCASQLTAAIHIRSREGDSRQRITKLSA